jgi:hypothetical protein
MGVVTEATRSVRGRLMRPARVLVAAVVFIAVASSPGVPVGATGKPTLSIDRTTAQPGSPIFVSGTGWPAETLVQIAVCGNLALDGSVDCALASSINVATRRDGRLSATTTVVVPPSPCPCVVRVNDLSSSINAQVVITIPGAPVGDAGVKATPPDVARAVRLSAVRLGGARPWTAWFGAGFDRALVATVTNVSSTAISSLDLSVRIGRSEHPTGVVEAPSLASLAPGESQTIRVPVHVGALSWGDYYVRVQVSGFGRPATATVHASTFPWAALVVVLVVLQLLLLAIRNRVRRRVDPTPVEHLPPALVADELAIARVRQGLLDTLGALERAATTELGTTPASSAVVDRLREAVQRALAEVAGTDAWRDQRAANAIDSVTESPAIADDGVNRSSASTR